MPALRFFALATLAFILPAGTFMWHQHIALVERWATRILEGPALTLAPGQRVTWRLDLGGDSMDDAWMHVQRQPRLEVPGLPPGTRLSARARYVATESWPEARAFLGAGPPTEVRPAEASSTGTADFGALWLNYAQPLELEVEVLSVPPNGDAPSSRNALPNSDTIPIRPRLLGEVSADYSLARRMERSVFIVFVILGMGGVVLWLFTERHRRRELDQARGAQ